MSAFASPFPSLQSLPDRGRHPANRYRPILNIAVPPDQPEQEVLRKTAWIAEQGYGGLAVNGMSPTPVRDVADWLPGYLRSCRRYVEAAEAVGLEVWIFDEWGYPSGTACGQVLEGHLEYRAKKLHLALDRLLEPGQTVDYPAPDRFVAAGVLPVDRFSFYHPAGPAVPLAPQQGRIRCTAAAPCRLAVVTWEYVSFVTHVMKRNAPDDPALGTIDLLDRRAVRRFLDCMHEQYVEPLGYAFGSTVKGFFYDEPEICYDFPFTPALPAYFERRCGYPLADILPELLTYLPSEMGVTGGDEAYPRLRRQFDDYSEAWCALLAESFYGQLEDWCHAHGLLSVGHQDLDNHLVSLRSVSGDFWKNSARNDRPGVDVIWEHIRPGAFADFPRYAGAAGRALGKDGAMSETFAEMGPSMYPDLMRYDMEHQILRGVDQFFLYCNHDPDDPNVAAFARAVNDRVERTCLLCNEGAPGAETAIYVPMRDVAFDAAHSNPHLQNSRPLPWERVERLAEALAYQPVDFDYAWEDACDNLYARGVRTLLLPGAVRLDERNAAALRAFARQGGRVAALWKPCEALKDCCAFYPDPSVCLSALSSGLTLRAGERCVSLCVRRHAQGNVYLLLNESESRFSARLRFDQAGALWTLDDRDGGWLPVPCARDGALEIEFAPRELKTFALQTDGTPQPATARDPAVTLTGWTLTTPDGERRPLSALSDWPSLGYADYTGWMTYDTAFDWQGGGLLLSLGEVRFSARVTLDGVRYDLPFSPYTLRASLAAGRHQLRVEVLNTNANALYAGPDEGRGRFTGDYWSLYQFERAYQTCGLLGPVAIRPIA